MQIFQKNDLEEIIISKILTVNTVTIRPVFLKVRCSGKGEGIETSYIDEEPQDELIVIEDFFDFYLYFEQYVKGGRLIYCQECGKLVHVVNKQDNSKKYCKKCQKEKQYEWEQKSRKKK